MHQAFLARGNLHKGAEVHQPGDAAVVVGAGLGVVDNGVHNVQSPLALLEIQAGDEHMAVLFHVHLHFALGADLLDDLAAAADDLPDLVHGNLGGEHLGGVGGELGAHLGNGLQDDFVNDIVAGLVGLFQGFLHHGGGQALDLQIHLDGGDALLGAAHLKVHVAEEILDALDVHHGHPAVPLGDQAAGDAGHRGLDGHARVHQGQGGAADGSLAGGAVGGQHLAD